MQWELVVALVIAIPIILFPATFVWYLNIGGIYAAIKRARERRVRAKRDAIVVVRTFGPTDIISTTVAEKQRAAGKLVGEKR